ncbi:MAG: acyltransferase family protein [Christensenellaceae bacterium]|nr:acyltransferase family protein [Christensenellaceae bacterium]
MGRKHYIDNLRWLCVLALFPYHTFMVFNSFGESFYVHGASVTSTTWIIQAMWPWLMPLMFVLAGISSAYALNKRSCAEYVKERVLRLLVPLIFGILLLVPLQTYIEERFHNGYTGGYLAQYILFFTKPTDLSGYNGGFTPAHLWFILYLFVISLIGLPLMRLYQKSQKKLNFARVPTFALLPLFLIPCLMQMILDISGKSVGEYFAFFMLGYLVLSDEIVLQKLIKSRWWLTALVAACLAVYLVVGGALPILPLELLYSFIAWAVILALLGLAGQYLNFENSTTAYLSKASFSLYLFHQQWVVVAAYFALAIVPSVPLQMIAIIAVSFALTLLTYEIARRVGFFRVIFGMKQ